MTVSDANMTAILTLVSTIFTAVMAYLMARLNARVNAGTTAIKAQTVVTTEKLSEIADTTEKVHKLTNSAMTAQLILTASVSRRVAVLTKSVDDVAAADLAEKLLAEHNSRQMLLDRATEATW